MTKLGCARQLVSPKVTKFIASEQVISMDGVYAGVCLEQTRLKILTEQVALKLADLFSGQVKTIRRESYAK